MKSISNKVFALILSMIFCCDVSLFTNDWYLIKWHQFTNRFKEFNRESVIKFLNKLFDSGLSTL
ncbi:MAG: hypothetical protein M3Z92_13380 [Bacteroidota bacterium]|nr:hypothetical protein [Bacteroidota bacterium]MDQ6889218.1 hypothetical protein [Bacteroidota bacterium]